MAAIAACVSERGPLPARVPTTPAASCVADADCRASGYALPVDDVTDCYCLDCPVPIPVDEAQRNEAGWLRHCSGAWEGQADCRQRDCARRTGHLSCQDKQCAWQNGAGDP